MTDASTVQVLQDRIAELEEEVRQLKAKLVDTDFRVPPEWGLTPKEEGLAIALARRDTLTKEQAMAALWSPKWDTDGEPAPKMVDVVVCKLRKKLKPFGVEIKTVWGRGYQMAPEHRALMKRSGRP